MPRALALLGLLLLAPAAEARAPWRWPVPGRTVLRDFAVGPDRYAPGQRRGVTLAAPPGAPVRAVCAGRVTFAGRVGASGRTVSEACGALSATYTRLGRVAVRRGAYLVPGQTLGAVGARGAVQLGARVRARRDGYLDPLRLLGAAEELPRFGPAPPRRRGPRLPPPRAAVPRAAPAPARIPSLWPALGLALVTAAGAFGMGRWVGGGGRRALPTPVASRYEAERQPARGGRGRA